MKPLFLFRPEPGWAVSAKSAEDMGLEVFGAPLFTIEPVEWRAPLPGDFDGLLVGSANVFRHGGPQLKKFDKLPVHVVGEATAAAARSAGFLIGRTGRGGLQSLVDQLGNRTLHLLRLAGEDRVTLRLPDSLSVDTRVLYRAVPQGLSDAAIANLQDGGVVALHSGSAAQRFKAECDTHDLDRAKIDLVVIGPRVAEMVGAGWRSIHIAEAPGDTELLALARSLCQTS